MASQVQSGGALALPLTLIAQAIPQLSRHDLEALTERLIDQLDTIDGDADFDEDGSAGQCDEDGVNCGSGEFAMHGSVCGGPGCPISDGLG